MPFVELDWSQSNNLSVNEQDDSILIYKRLCRPFLTILRMLGQYDKSEDALWWKKEPRIVKRREAYKIYMRKAWRITVGILCLLGLLYHCYQLTSESNRSPLSPIVFVHLVILIQAIAALILLNVDSPLSPKRIIPLMELVASGVGLYRQTRRTTRLLRLSMIIFALFILLIVAHRLLHQRTISMALPTYWHDHAPSSLFNRTQSNIVVDIMDYVEVVTLTYSLLVWLAYNALVFSATAITTTEFEAFNADIEHDTNVYQLPVLRHYCTLHYRLRHLNEHLDRQLAIYYPLTMYFNCLMLGVVVIQTSRTALGVIDLATLAIYVAFLVFQLAIVFLLCTRLYNRTSELDATVAKHTTSSTDTDVYSYASLYLLVQKQKAGSGITFLGFYPMSTPNMVMTLILWLCLLIWSKFNYIDQK